MRKAILSLVLGVTCCNFAIAGDPPAEKMKSSEAILDPTAAQKKTAYSKRVLEEIQLDHPTRKSRAGVAQPNVARTYSLRDFPVWSEDGKKFDASILIALIKSKVLSGQWNDDGNMILPFAKTTSLVISTTEDAHEEIEEILEELRQTLK